MDVGCSCSLRPSHKLQELKAKTTCDRESVPVARADQVLSVRGPDLSR
jgi:hypothetical protein